MRKLTICLFLFVFVFAMNGAKADNGSATLFKKKCSSCHSLDLSLNKKYDEQTWKSTIVRMEGFGLKIKPNEADAIAKYLASQKEK